MAKLTGKELIQEFCENLQNNLNMDAWSRNVNPDKVEFISMQLADEWIVEIRVNNRVIFRESAHVSTGKSMEILEEALINRTLSSVFSHGVMASKRDLEKFNPNA